jgi:hypothetical protein
VPSPAPGGAAARRTLVALCVAAAATVVGYDALAAWASLAVPFEYRLALVGSCLVYGTFGFVGARRLGFGRALAMGAWMGLVDASLGWAVSWHIGAGRLPGGPPGAGFWLLTALYVGALGLVFAAAGAGLAVVTQSRPRLR